jgi:hypothetical protein
MGAAMTVTMTMTMLMARGRVVTTWLLTMMQTTTRTKILEIASYCFRVSTPASGVSLFTSLSICWDRISNKGLCFVL